MSKIRKIITTGLIATTLVTAVVASTPASAWYRRYAYYGGCYGYYGSCGYPAAYNYAYPARFCVARNPVYDDWGNFVGYQRMRVAC
jgi:hypothetical protein